MVTHGTKVWSRSDGTQEIMTWIDAVHEEADNRMVVHIQDMLLKGISCIQVRTVDTDVVAILLAFMLQFKEYNSEAEIWIDFGTGQEHRRYIHVNTCFEQLGIPICLASLFFHTFMGCDSTC